MESGDALSVRMAVNTLFMLLCTFLLLMVVLGISIFYSGLVQRRSAFTILSVPLLLLAIFMLDWFIWGYSLCYSPSGNRFIGNLLFSVLRHLRDQTQRVYSTPRGEILASVHFLFNGFLKIICIVLTFPACIAERGRIIPMILFVFCWSTIVYNPVTYWFWNEKGWLSLSYNKVPVLDFAGGNCIHIVSGFTALAYSYVLGPRNPKLMTEYRNSNSGNVIIGIVLLAVGWCGFIAGCDYKFSDMSIFIIINIWLCGSTAGIIWALIDYYNSATPLEVNALDDIELQHLNNSNEDTLSKPLDDGILPKRKISMISFSSGFICGLVVFTPCGGYLSTSTGFWKSIVCGVVGGAIGNVSTGLKYLIRVDDSLDIFAIHGVCGFVGSLLVGIFAVKGQDSKGGWVDGHWVLFAYQLVGCIVTMTYVSVLSLVLLYIIDIIPGLHLRIDHTYNKRSREKARGQHTFDEETLAHKLDPEGLLEQAELMGTDRYELDGEYCMDFMEFINVLDPHDYTGEIDARESESQGVGYSRYDGEGMSRLKRRPIN